MVPLFILSIFTLFFFFTSFTVAVPLTGSLTIPGDYLTLDSAIKDLNTNGVGTGGVTFNLLPGNPQTAPVGGYSITAIGTGSNQIVFNGNGNIITASSSLISGSLTDAIFKLIGADYVTINNFALNENPSNSTQTPASNNMTEWGIALLRAASNNGSQNNTITGNTITLKKQYANSFGIYSSTRHTATDVITVSNAGSDPGINRSNSIKGNTISNVNFPVSIIGSGAPGLLDTDNKIGGDSAEGNSLTNFGGKAIGSAFAAFPGSAGFGIYADQQDGFVISSNRIFSDSAVLLTTFSGIHAQNTATISYNSSDYIIDKNTVTVFNALATGLLNGIYIQLGADVSADKETYIRNNVIKDCSSGGITSASFNGIYNLGSMKRTTISGNTFTNNLIASSSGQATPLNINSTSDTVIISNNNIGNIANPGIRFSSANSTNQIMIRADGINQNISILGNNFYGVNFSSTGSGGITFIRDKAIKHSRIDSNFFHALTINNSGPVKFISREPVSILSSSQISICDNRIVTGFLKSAAGDTVTFITGNNYLTLSAATITVKRNVMFNITLSGNTSFYGIVDEQGNLDGLFSLTKIIEDNLISTITNTTSSSQVIKPLRIKRCAANSSISNNMINTITWNGNVANRIISADSMKLWPLKISGNVINNVSTSATCTGISVQSRYSCEISDNIIYLMLTNSGSTGISAGCDTTVIFKNKLSEISGNLVGRGIHVLSGNKVNNIYNNIIGDIASVSGTTNPSETGITLEGTAVNNIYYNTIRLTDVPGSGLTAGSACLYIAGASSLTLINNILINLAPETFLANRAYVIRSSSLITGFYNIASNNNLFYIFQPGLGRYIYSDGSNTDQTLTTFKTRVAPRDSNSVSGTVQFKSLSGNSDDYLHVNDTITNIVESKGKIVAGINVDYDGDTRQGSVGYIGTDTAPDIGADEFFTNPLGNNSVDLTFFIQGFYNSSTNSQTGDTARVYLRSSSSPYGVVDSAKAFFDASGFASLTFLNSSAGNYFLEIKHRNSIRTWSKQPVSLSPSGTIAYNFTDSLTKAYGNNLSSVDATPLTYAIFGTDINQDGFVNISDIILVYNAASVFASGYVSTDVTGDNTANISDIIITYNNSATFVSQQIP